MEPCVVLDVDFERGAFELVLLNCGDLPAHDVRVDFEPDIVGLVGRLDVGSLPIFTGLGVLRPGREIRIFLDSAASVWSHDSYRFRATVGFADSRGKRQTREYTHDLHVFRNLPQIAAT